MRRAVVLLLFTAATALLQASPGRADELDPGFVEPSATPFIVPAGLYLVTDVYAGDVVSAFGGTTTYTTVTIRADPGTWARVLDTVGTGVASAFDGRSFNGRARLSDGRGVAGTYYQTFVLTASGFVPVSIVFFQDDSETRDVPAPSPVSTVLPTIAPPVASAVPSSPGPRLGTTPLPAPAPTRLPAPTHLPAPTLPPIPVIATAGVALAAAGPTLSSIELLRGRVVQLWPRVFADGVSLPVRSWRLVAGADGLASANTGSGSEPCSMSWLLPSGDGIPYAVRFEVTSDALPGRVVTARVAVAVRSPALLQ